MAEANVPDSKMQILSFTDLQPYTPPMEGLFVNAKSINDYELADYLGDGASSTVNKAKRKSDNVVFAIKKLRQPKVSVHASTLSREAFREATLLRNLKHENVIKVHDVILEADPNRLSIVLEFCPYTLSNYLEAFKVDGENPYMKGVAMHLLRGLNYLHKNFIIHRDIKVSNLLISADGLLKIIDFGLSRRFSSRNPPSSPGVMTRWYKAPEILYGAPTYTCKADIWSAGCVIAELFLKRPLLEGSSDLNQINLIIDTIGSPSLEVWPGFADCPQFKQLKFKRQPYSKIDEIFGRDHLTSQEAIDLFNKVFVYDPESRLSAEECLLQPWLNMAPRPAVRLDLSVQELTAA